MGEVVDIVNEEKGEPLAKCYEEVDMQGASERGSEAYTMYVELSSERQHSRSAPQ
jgi:hypothetical protein